MARRGPCARAMRVRARRSNEPGEARRTAATSARARPSRAAWRSAASMTATGRRARASGRYASSIAQRCATYQRARSSTAAKKPSQPCTVRKQPQRGSGVERDAGARELGRGVARRELRMRGEERVDDRARSPRAARCTSRRRGGRRASPASPRRRGSTPASPRARRRRTAGCRHLRSGLRRSVPKPVHGASTSTRSILPARRFTLVSRSLASTCGCTFDSPERVEPRREVGEPLSRDVERVEASLRAHQRAEQQRLAAGAGAEIDDHVAAPRRDEVADELAAFVLHFEAAVGEPRMLRERRRGRRRECPAASTASASAAKPSAASAASAASRVAFSGLTRRSNGAGASHARASAMRVRRRRRRRPAAPTASREGRARRPAAAASCSRDLNARSHSARRPR